MKKSVIISTILLLSAVSISAQESPRKYVTFKTERGSQVRVVSPSVAANPKNTAPRSSMRVVTTYYLPSPAVVRYKAPANAKLVKKTAQMTMTVYEGYAHREAPRAVIPRIMASKPVNNGQQVMMIVRNHLKGFSTGDSLVDSYIIDSSHRYNIDPLLIYAQMSQESSFKRGATSHKGASGLMQLMPATARRLGVTNIYDPKQNIEGGVKYMRMLLNMFGGDVKLALAGYNAGEGAVLKYGIQIPPYNETRDYVRRISARYATISKSDTARNSGQEKDAITNRLADGRLRLVNK